MITLIQTKRECSRNPRSILQKAYRHKAMDFYMKMARAVACMRYNSFAYRHQYEAFRTCDGRRQCRRSSLSVIMAYALWAGMPVTRTRITCIFFSDCHVILIRSLPTMPTESSLCIATDFPPISSRIASTSSHASFPDTVHSKRFTQSR